MLRQRRLVAGSKQLTTRDRAAACRMMGYPGYPLTATLLVLALCLERGAGQVCPYGWYGRPGSDSCYLINTDSTKYKWPDAVDKCQAYNGQLVVISDTQERDWLFQTLAEVTAAVPSVDSWWIGIKFQDSKYSWVDDTPLNNSLVPWDKGLPGDSQGPCVAIVKQKVSNYTCLNWCNLLCERFKSVPLQCDVDNKWNFINGSCFKIYSDKRTWQDAKQMCDLQDSQLAKVSSFTAHADLWDASRRLGVNLWAGLQAANNSGQLVMTWTDGSHLEATDQNFWVDGQPSLAPNTSQCMYINGGIPRRLKSWQLGDCNSLNGYTCQKPPGECQDGWLTHQSTCFKLFDDMQSWSVANLTCTGIGGQLVNLASPSDQMFLQRYLPVFASEYVDSIWIGLNDNGNDYGPITWSGGKNIGNATHWADNPPPNNTVGNLDCGFIDTSDSEGRWQLTSDCTVIRSWVCTIPVNTPVQPMPTSVSPYLCDPMWIQFGLSCYFFSDGPEIWSDARRMCKSFEADLVVITGDRDQAFLNRHVTGGDFWIGLHDIIVEGTWLWVNNNQPRYFHWAAGEPNSAGNEDCVAIFGSRGPSQNGLWNDYDCSKRYNYICQKAATRMIGTTSPTTTTTPPVVVSAKCGEFWEERPGSDFCYQFHSQVQDYASAAATCSSYNGSLVSISNQVEQSYLAGRARSMAVGGVWLGATDATQEGGWYWTDDVPFAYVNWDSDEPNNEGSNQDCAAMMTRTSRWHDFNCDLKFGFICKKSAFAMTTRPPPPTSPLPSGMYYGCPSGWIGYNYKCYLTVTTPASWTDSQSRCRAVGAELVTITSRLENNFLVSQLPRYLVNPGMWIGLTDVTLPGSFTWADNSPVTFTNWAVNEPSGGGVSGCTTVFTSGQWFKKECSTQTGYVCKKPMTVSALTSISPLQIGCPVGALGYGSLCYLIVDSLSTPWSAAETYCNSRMGGHLATVNTKEVQFFITGELVTLKSAPHYWIGLSDTATPGTYRWSSGSSLLYTAWGSNHTGNERGTCVGLSMARPIGLWQNLACTQLRPFVCEIPRRGYTTTTTTTPAITTTPSPCPNGWQGYQNTCYKAFNDRSVQTTWNGARTFCRNYGGDLASIHSSDVNDFFRDQVLRMLFTGNFWIGLTDVDKEATYVWSDGTPFDFARWVAGEPNNMNGAEDCAQFVKYANAWNDGDCYNINPFICSLPRGQPLRTTSSPPPTTPMPTCYGTQWLANGGSCYYVSPTFGSDAKKTWFAARRFCRANGAELASIATDSANNFLMQILATRMTTDERFWIGLNKLGGARLQWSDGSPVVFQSWADGEPNDGNGGEMCVNTRARSGLWNDDNCNDEFGFICERSNGTSTPLNPVPTPRIQGGCPPGFSGLDNKCFYVNSTAALGWEAARNACRSMVLARPADIASITSHQELVLVMSLLENVTTDVYIGLNDRQTNAHFVWQTNEEVVLTNWAPNQPSERWRLLGGSSEDCVVMRVQLDIFGQWDDVSCVEKHGYVCQTTRDPSYSMESPVIGGCKGNYYHYRDSCYGNYRMPKTWAEAEATCVLDNGHLVSIRDIHELASVDIFLYIDVVVSASWIGLTYNETTGSYSWVDQWPVTFTQWGQGEPDITKSAACVAMADGKWNDTDCNDLRPFTCKISTAAPPTTTPAPPGYCASPSWAPNGDYCYYAAPSNTQSWPEANYICRKLGMELLSLHSADELSFVQSLVTLAVTTPRYNWRLPSSGVTKVWIGLERTLQGGFRWSDGSPTNYLPWNTGEPNNENDNEDCAEVLISVGKFNDMPCMGISQGFVCKAPKVFPTSTTTTTPSQTTTAESVTSKTTTGTQASTRRLGWPNYRPLVSPATRRTKNSLSGGEIAGIVIGLLAFIAIVGTVVYVLRHRRVVIKPPAEREEPSAGFDNALYDKTHDQVALASNGIHLNHADSEDC